VYPSSKDGNAFHLHKVTLLHYFTKYCVKIVKYTKNVFCSYYMLEINLKYILEEVERYKLVLIGSSKLLNHGT